MTQPLSQRLEARAVFHEFQIASLGPETIGAIRLVKDVELLREAAQLAKRMESAATGQVVEVGNLPVYEDEDGNSAFTGYLIQATPTEIRDAPPIIYRRVALVTLEEP